MTKRTADEALLIGGRDRPIGNGEIKIGSSSLECIPQSSNLSINPSEKRQKHHVVHRISSCSIAPSSEPSSLSLSKASSTASLYRMAGNRVSDAAVTIAAAFAERQKSEESKRSLTRLVNARILQSDGSLPLGSMTVDPSIGVIVRVEIYQSADGEEKKVEESEDSEGMDEEDVQVIDCQKRIVSPGFIDIQLNGAFGVDFSNDGTGSIGSTDGNKDEGIDIEKSEQEPNGEQRGLSIQSVLHVAHRLLETGVTAFCPTMVSSSPDTYRRILPLIRQARKEQYWQHKSLDEPKQIGANILGMHLEGPFFAHSKRGAHNQQCIVDAFHGGASSVMDVYGLSNKSNEKESEDDENPSVLPTLQDIDIITLAPELDGACDAIKSLTSQESDNTKSHSVVVSCGHTEANYQDGIHAVRSGATLLTHLYNAMNPFHHREPGLVGLLSSEAKLGRMGLERPFFSLIVDGIHVHESAVTMAYQNHPHGCVLVTDAMAAMGLGDGTHSLGDMSVCIKGDRATLLGTNTLAGSVVSMDTCVRRFRDFTGCSTGEALLCATLHPAKVLKRHLRGEKVDETNNGECTEKSGGNMVGLKNMTMGVLEAGAAADFIMLDDDLQVLGTWVGGKHAFERKAMGCD